MARSHGVNRPRKHRKAPVKPKPSKGLGDTVEKIIQRATGGKVKSCEGCKKRRDALNRLVPYKGCKKCGKEG